MIIPKIIPAAISPKIIVLMLTGKDSNLSKVPACFSQGVIRGPTDEAAKNRDIAKSPGKKKNKFTALPR